MHMCMYVGREQGDMRREGASGRADAAIEKRLRAEAYEPSLPDAVVGKGFVREPTPHELAERADAATAAANAEVVAAEAAYSKAQLTFERAHQRLQHLYETLSHDGDSDDIIALADAK